MVTIGSGGIPKLGGGMQAMDILKRLGMKRGMGAADAGAFGAPPAPAAAPAAMAPAAPPRDMVSELSALEANPEGSGMGAIAPMQAGKRFSDPSILNRIGDFVQSDRGRATLLRSGAATLQGGLGAGIAAGAAYNDDQKEKEAKQMNWVSEMGLKTRATDIDQQQADQTGQYQAARADIDSTQTAINEAVARENARRYRASENIDIMEEGGRNTRFGIGDQTDNRRIDATVYATDAGIQNNIRSTDATIYGADSSRYTAAENRALEGGRTASATGKLPNGGTIRVNRKAPEYGELRYDKQGNAYRLDGFTGQPVRVTP